MWYTFSKERGNLFKILKKKLIMSKTKKVLISIFSVAFALLTFCGQVTTPAVGSIASGVNSNLEKEINLIILKELEK